MKLGLGLTVNFKLKSPSTTKQISSLIGDDAMHRSEILNICCPENNKRHRNNCLVIIRPHRQQAVHRYGPTQPTDIVRRVVRMYVCWNLGIRVSCVKTAEPIKTLFGRLTYFGQTNHTLDGVQIPTEKVTFGGHVPAKCRPNAPTHGECACEARLVRGLLILCCWIKMNEKWRRGLLSNYLGYLFNNNKTLNSGRN